MLKKKEPSPKSTSSVQSKLGQILQYHVQHWYLMETWLLCNSYHNCSICPLAFFNFLLLLLLITIFFIPLFFLCLISNCNWKIFHTHFLFLNFRFSLLRYQVRNIQMAFSSVMFCHYKFWKCCLIDTVTHFRNSYDLAKCDNG